MKDQDQLLDLQTTDSFRLYLDEVGRHPLLTKEDEIELSQAYEAGLAAREKLAKLDPADPGRAEFEVIAARGEQARRTMIESNLRLVVSIARRFSATGLPLGDLVQEGNLGLLRAVEKFDWRKGFKFSTYATWWIRQAIARGAADRGARAIRLPVHVDEQVGRLRRTQTRMHELLGREPTDDELADELDMPLEKVHRPGDHLAGHPDRGRWCCPAGLPGGRLGHRARRARGRGGRPGGARAGARRPSSARTPGAHPALRPGFRHPADPRRGGCGDGVLAGAGASGGT